MGFKFFETKGEKDKPFLVLDIGTEAIKVLFLKKKTDGKIIVQSASNQYFEEYGVFNGKDFGENVIKRAISKAIEEAYQNFFLFFKGKKPRFKIEKLKKLPILLNLPANVLRGRVVWQSFIREDPKKKISDTEQKSIFEQCFQQVQKEVSQRFAKDCGILPGDIRWITKKILEIKIDGYSVSKLLGYDGKNLELRTFVTFLPKYYLAIIERIFKDLGLKLFRIVHLAENLAAVWEDKKMDSIFFDVGGEITQIFLVKGGYLNYLSEFNGGGKTFSQRLSDTLGIEEELARDLKERYTNKILSRGTTQRVKEIFLPEKKIWYENLKIKMKEVAPKILLPSTVFLFGGGSLLPEIQEVLKENRIGNSTDSSTENLPDVKIIYPKNLRNIEDSAKRLTSPQYTPPLLISYYAKEIF